jgi:hypothetical protein
MTSFLTTSASHDTLSASLGFCVFPPESTLHRVVSPHLPATFPCIALFAGEVDGNLLVPKVTSLVL